MGKICIWVYLCFGGSCGHKKHYFSNASNISLGYGDTELSKGDINLFTPMSKIQSCLL